MKLRQEIADLRLTDKQKRFCEEYLIDFDATKAVKRSGYHGKNASTVASQIMSSESVQAYIAILKKELSERVNLRLEDVVREYMRIGFARIDEMVSWSKETVTLKPSKTLTEDQLAAVASVENTREGIKIKMHGKLEALAKLKEFCDDPGEKGKTKPAGDTYVNVNEVRVLLADPAMRQSLDKVSQAFIGRRLKSLTHLDAHVEKVTNEIFIPKSNSRTDH